MSLSRLLATGLGLVFVVAGFVKVQDPHAFAVAVDNYQLVPQAWTGAVAICLAWLELLCGLCLVFGVLVRGAALLVACMMTVFLAALGYNAHRGLDVSCGCFGQNGPVDALTFVRDAALLLTALLVMTLGSEQRKRP